MSLFSLSKTLRTLALSSFFLSPLSAVEDSTELDNSSLSPASYVQSTNGTHIAYSLSEMGTEWNTWKIIHIEKTSTDSPRIDSNIFSPVIWSLTSEGHGFYYSKIGSNHADDIYYHAIGTNPKGDQLIYQDPHSFKDFNAAAEWLIDHGPADQKQLPSLPCSQNFLSAILKNHSIEQLGALIIESGQSEMHLAAANTTTSVTPVHPKFGLQLLVEFIGDLIIYIYQNIGTTPTTTTPTVIPVPTTTPAAPVA